MTEGDSWRNKSDTCKTMDFGVVDRTGIWDAPIINVIPLPIILLIITLLCTPPLVHNGFLLSLLNSMNEFCLFLFCFSYFFVLFFLLSVTWHRREHLLAGCRVIKSIQYIIYSLQSKKAGKTGPNRLQPVIWRQPDRLGPVVPVRLRSQ